MLLLGQTLLNKPILSLRAGTPVGVIVSPIINPNNLKIEGWHATNSRNRLHGILLSQDIRDILAQGVVIDDQDAITPPDELIRLKEILDLNFVLEGKVVVTTGKSRLGKVNDYALDKDTFMIQKLHVTQSIVKSFSGGALLIDRSQIVEINEKRIVVKETTTPLGSRVPAVAPAQS